MTKASNSSFGLAGVERGSAPVRYPCCEVSVGWRPVRFLLCRLSATFLFDFLVTDGGMCEDSSSMILPSVNISSPSFLAASISL